MDRRPPYRGVKRPNGASGRGGLQNHGARQALMRLMNIELPERTNQEPSDVIRNDRNQSRRVHHQGTSSGIDLNGGGGYPGMRSGPSVGNNNNSHKIPKNLIQSLVTNQNRDEGWMTENGSRRRNRKEDQGPNYRTAASKVGDNNKYKGEPGRGRPRKSLQSSSITQLNTLDDWNNLSTLSDLSIMMKLQELESSWVESFHSDTSLEVMDVAFVLFGRLNDKWKYRRLAIVKSLFTPLFIDRLIQLLEPLTKTWVITGRDKVVAYIEHLRLNIEFILTNDPGFHDSESPIARGLSSLIQKIISILTHINTKMVELQGSDDNIIDAEILKVEELRTIEYIQTIVLDKPLYPEGFRSLPDAIMPNTVLGPYQSDNHYLETHFGLLKEDFDSNLREGVEQYLSDPKQKNHKIWIYQNVIVRRDFSSQNTRQIGPTKILFRVHFPECKSFSNIDWDHTKRFMFGSLVVLTTDKFETCHFGVIEDRDFKKPSAISIVICFINAPPKAVQEAEVLLVEPTVFYEPYFQAMKVLKQIARGQIPLKRYLVNVESTLRCPSYINGDTRYRIGPTDIKICDALAWPNAEELGLNVSQRRAFIHALTNELAVIQGPPGTGKTTLALKIIKTLICNRSKFSGYWPIMVVCYKNHSLDQILEKLLETGVRVVRIGGMSKVDVIKEKCSLKNIPFSSGVECIAEEKKTLESKLSAMVRDLQDVINVINLIKSRIGIIHSDLLSQCLNVPAVNLPDKMDQWLLELLEEPPQFQLEDIERRGIDLSVYASLQRVFGFTGFESLFVTNLFNIGCETLNYHEMLINGKEYCDSHFWHSFNQYNFLSHGLSLAVDSSVCPDPKSSTFPGYHQLEVKSRWALYNKWEHKFISMFEDRLATLQNQILEIQSNLLEFDEMILSEKLKYGKPHVIGATTSGAARHYTALVAAGAKFVLVEEAAEVLEAHVVAGITSKCEHLVMIGDHQQLRPSTASFELGNQYGMSTSLFERMIKNGVQWLSLSTQHRMRPEIAALICPSIYTNLQNSPSVSLYPNVLGTNKNVFFFDHCHQEEVGVDSESKFNSMEAEMLLAIFSYLVKQGYKPKDITILSTYLAQNRFISRKLKQWQQLGDDSKVNNTVVDNYQGEENTIILLSLVRNNVFGDVGFLSSENRVCVALSRAKHGLFIFGNMSCLKKKQTSIWRKIDEVLVGQEAVGTTFPLKCVKHGNITEVGSPEDVNALTNGGCINPCETELSCGHTCRQMCHSTDLTHSQRFGCREICNRKCPNDHACNEVCNKTCPPCQIRITKLLDCGHSQQLECCKPNLQKYCTETVEIQMDTCGHNQMILCKNTIDRTRTVCNALCLKENTCGHICKRKCHVKTDPDHTSTKRCVDPCGLVNKSCPRKHKCNKKCGEPCGDCLVQVNKTLPCDHSVQAVCSDDLTNFICKQKVKKVVEACGHRLEVKCSEEPSRKNCINRCVSNRSCGHQCPGLCNSDCEKEFCNEVVEKDLPCGHKLHEACGTLEKHRQDIIYLCKTPCEALLPCGHICKGTCAKCFQNRIHVPCTLPCSKTLVCSHNCKSSCNHAFHSCLNPKCLEKCWINEINNPSFYKTQEKGKGKAKRVWRNFDPVNKLLLDLQNALCRKSQGSTPNARDLPSNNLIPEILGNIRKFIMKPPSFAEGYKLSILKTYIFITEFVSVFCVTISRLMNSSMSSTKKTELQTFLEKMIYRVSSRNSPMVLEMQQLQEQMVWVSLTIDAHEIGNSKGNEVVEALHRALEDSKFSFGSVERCTTYELVRALREETPGISVPIATDTDPCKKMFPDTFRWCQPIHHHLLPRKYKVSQNEINHAKRDEKVAVEEYDSKKRSKANSNIKSTGNEEVDFANEASKVASMPPTNASPQEYGGGTFFGKPGLNRYDNAEASGGRTFIEKPGPNRYDNAEASGGGTFIEKPGPNRYDNAEASGGGTFIEKPGPNRYDNAKASGGGTFIEKPGPNRYDNAKASGGGTFIEKPGPNRYDNASDGGTFIEKPGPNRYDNAEASGGGTFIEKPGPNRYDNAEASGGGTFVEKPGPSRNDNADAQEVFANDRNSSSPPEQNSESLNISKNRTEALKRSAFAHWFTHIEDLD